MGRSYYDGHRDCPGPKAARIPSWQGGVSTGRAVPLYVRVYTGARMTAPQPSETTQKRGWTRVGTLCVDCGGVWSGDTANEGAPGASYQEMRARASGLTLGELQEVDQGDPAGLPSEPEP